MDPDNTSKELNPLQDDNHLLRELLLGQHQGTASNQRLVESSPLTQFAEVVITSPGACHQCEYHRIHPYSIQINSIKAENSGWIAKGEGHSETIYCRCMMCASHYRAVRQVIPILCQPFACPKCGEPESLQYKISSVTADKDSFQFEVEIECKACSKKRSLRNTIKEILKVINLEVGPTGITVKKA